ncbi:MAG: hypothetical protein RLZZ234_357, partial [Candidatus Parcubacteria bacterium]
TTITFDAQEGIALAIEGKPFVVAIVKL